MVKDDLLFSFHKVVGFVFQFDYFNDFLKRRNFHIFDTKKGLF